MFEIWQQRSIFARMNHAVNNVYKCHQVESWEKTKHTSNNFRSLIKWKSQLFDGWELKIIKIKIVCKDVSVKIFFTVLGMNAIPRTMKRSTWNLFASTVFFIAQIRFNDVLHAQVKLKNLSNVNGWHLSSSKTFKVSEQISVLLSVGTVSVMLHFQSILCRTDCSMHEAAHGWVYVVYCFWYVLH